ncbi:MAG: hypothetical protein QF645_08290, partial [Planctomycetota bacterium]|nr:hypothetical protein [Planctomycetota bacterium]
TIGNNDDENTNPGSGTSHGGGNTTGNSGTNNGGNSDDDDSDGSEFPGHTPGDEFPGGPGGGSGGGPGGDKPDATPSGTGDGTPDAPDTPEEDPQPEQSPTGDDEEDNGVRVDVIHDEEGDGFTLRFSDKYGNTLDIHFTQQEDGTWEHDLGDGRTLVYTGDKLAEGSVEYTDKADGEAEVDGAKDDSDDTDYPDPTQDGMRFPVVSDNPTKGFDGCGGMEETYSGEIPADKLQRREVVWAIMPNPLGGGPIIIKVRPSHGLGGGCDPINGSANGLGPAKGPDSRGPIRGTGGTKSEKDD